MIVTLLVVAVAMAVKDCLCTVETIAESKNRGWLAGICDGAYDIASVVCTVVGAGAIISHGFGWHAFWILLVMVTVSTFGTVLWTRIGHRLTRDTK